MIFDRKIELSFRGIELNPINEDHRIQFSLDKLDRVKFNSGSVTIYNLAERSRSLLARVRPLNRPMQEPIITVTLTAGYRDKVVNMFSGDIVSATNRREGPDWITVIELFTNFAKFHRSATNQSFAVVTPARTVTDRIIASMKIDVTYTEEAAAILKKNKVASFSASGLSYRLAHEFLSRYGLGFTIEEDGKALVYVLNKARDPKAGKVTANTFSPKTGLIGTPQITEHGVNITTLLRPEIRLLQKFYVESETIAGTLDGGGGEYMAKSITHFGDTRGDDWFTEIEGIYWNIVPEDYVIVPGAL